MSGEEYSDILRVYPQIRIQYFQKFLSFSPCFLEAFLAEPCLFLDLVVLAFRTWLRRHSLPRGSAVLAFPAVMRGLAGSVQMIRVNIEDQISTVPAFLFHWESRVLVVR